MDTASSANAAEAFLSAAAAGPYPAFGKGGVLHEEARAFLTGLFEDASDEGEDSPMGDDLLALAHDFYRWSQEVSEDEQAFRLRPATGAQRRPLQHEVLEIVGPDMPFLVDSVMGELSDQGLAALALAHPIAPFRGRARSYMQIHLRTPPPARVNALVQGVRATLADVRAIVSDFGALKARMAASARDLEETHAALPRAEISEAVALLEWLMDERFTFLGVRDYVYGRDEQGELTAVEPMIDEGSGLGILRDPDRYVLRTTSEPLLLTPEWKKLLNEPTPLVVAKSTLRSRVHRRTAADYVGVKRYDHDGRATGETRFIGLFTTEAYTDAARDIPYLRRKVAWVVQQAGFRSGGHSEKALKHVLEVYPRDDLWQIEQGPLLRTAREIVHLMDRPRARVFCRRDRFNRFVSALAFLPKERFNSKLRMKVGDAVAEAYGGVVESFHPQLDEGPLARVHFTIADIDRDAPDPEPGVLDRIVAELTRTWDDTFSEALLGFSAFDEATRDMVRTRFDGAFSAAYQERYDAEEALKDVLEILRAGEDQHVRVRAYRKPGDGADVLRCKIYSRTGLLPLSASLPIFEDLGLYVEFEQNVDVKPSDGGRIHIHDLAMRDSEAREIDFTAVDAAFEDAFEAIWDGHAESDGFNRIILRLGVSWREAALLRALARYRQQSGLDPSQMVQEDALAAHPDIAALILALFRVRFDPDLPETIDARRDWARGVEEKISAALNAVQSLDEDRVLRRMAALVGAIQRTNYYQRDEGGGRRPILSFKIASQSLADLPAPKPYREIWVSSPVVEGVHLRFGPVARGGLRWSDRRDDFRTEVLGLVKAQQVKNAIIVPVGAKGGFFPKKLPARSDKGYLDAGIAAYRMFLRGLLDITDNLVGGAVVPPRGVVRWDDDDPYLVVAADKGTATFSDIANDMAQEYGFWLGDAFASGGSAGYDHKAMGITARGAWEAVKRHFRELGKNIQEEAFDVIGVGDMSGDVFGNAMLLSNKIRLVAAFDHRHIFLDPNPRDLDAAWAERARLFKLPHSTWDDYDKTLISEGGGVFARSLKSIPLSEALADLTGIREQAATPAEIIAALLKAPCDLLFFGGIGTFIKSRGEAHASVGDKTNDVLRADAEDVRARVIGEGANLGVTQAGRIAFARKGGRINTDAVDNSAGVDTSDHEVNIKILLSDAIHSKKLREQDRDTLLADMTEAVSALVLKDNYDQTLALTLCEATAAQDLDSHERFMERLEAAQKLSRAVEELPHAEEIRALRTAEQGLTRPELSKLVAYAKIDLFDCLVASEAPDDPAFEAPLREYFPAALERYEECMRRHPLRREIIATYLADDVVNLAGPTFVDRVQESVRADAVTIACAFEAARRIFELNALQGEVNALDNRIPAAAQTQLHLEIAAAARRVVSYLVRHAMVDARGIQPVVEAYHAAVSAQRRLGADLLTETERARLRERAQSFEAAGAPNELAERVALLAPQTAALDAADLATQRRLPVIAAARLHREAGAAFGLDRLRAAAAGVKLDAHWDRLALRRAVENLFDAQSAIADLVAQRAPGGEPSAKWARVAIEAWRTDMGGALDAPLASLAQLEADGAWSFAKIMLAAAEANGLATAAQR